MGIPPRSSTKRKCAMLKTTAGPMAPKIAESLSFQQPRQ